MLNPALVYLLRRRRNGRRSCKRGIIGIRRVFQSLLLRVYVSVFDRFVRYDILGGDFRFSRVTCCRIWRSNRRRAARQNASRISSYRRHGYSNRVAYKASLTSVSKSLRRRDVFSRYGELAYLNRLRADYGRLPCSMPQKISKAKRALRSLIGGIEKSSTGQIFFFFFCIGGVVLRRILISSSFFFSFFLRSSNLRLSLCGVFILGKFHNVFDLLLN